MNHPIRERGKNVKLQTCFSLLILSANWEKTTTCLFPWRNISVPPRKPAQPMGTRIVQADSGSDSDSESLNKNEEIIPVNRLTPTVCTDPPELAATICTCTVKQRTFFAPTGADSRNRSRNRNLPPLYALRRLAPTHGIGARTGVCLHYTRTL
jgi:hypothetical protein